MVASRDLGACVRTLGILGMGGGRRRGRTKSKRSGGEEGWEASGIFGCRFCGRARRVRLTDVWGLKAGG